MPIGIAPSMLGLTVSGDVAGVTIYTDRFQRKISYEKAPPQKPASPWQRILRDKFKAAQAQFTALDASDRRDWEDLANRANLCMTGQNLLMHVAMKHKFGLLDTLMLQTGVSVNPPTGV